MSYQTCDATESKQAIKKEAAKSRPIAITKTFAGVEGPFDIESTSQACATNSAGARNSLLFDPLFGNSVPHLALGYFSTLSATAIRRITYYYMGLKNDYSSFGNAR
jgi:hypothetical protein